MIGVTTQYATKKPMKTFTSLQNGTTCDPHPNSAPSESERKGTHERRTNVGDLEPVEREQAHAEPRREPEQLIHDRVFWGPRVRGA